MYSSSMHFPSIEHTLAKFHSHLIHGYKKEGGGGEENCLRVALSLAEVLLAEERSPIIGSLSAEYFDEYLHPHIPGWSLSRGKHYICIDDVLVYEPLLGIKPVDISGYSKTLFNIEQTPKLAFTTTEIQDILKKGSYIIEDFPSWGIL